LENGAAGGPSATVTTVDKSIESERNCLVERRKKESDRKRIKASCKVRCEVYDESFCYSFKLMVIDFERKRLRVAPAPS
jgi:hypothetical protein